MSSESIHFEPILIHRSVDHDPHASADKKAVACHSMFTYIPRQASAYKKAVACHSMFTYRGKPQLQQLIFIQAMPVWDVGLMSMRMMMMVMTFVKNLF